MEIIVEGHRGRGRPHKTWDEDGALNIQRFYSQIKQHEEVQGRVKWK